MHAGRCVQCMTFLSNRLATSNPKCPNRLATCPKTVLTHNRKTRSFCIWIKFDHSPPPVKALFAHREPFPLSPLWTSACLLRWARGAGACKPAAGDTMRRAVSPLACIGSGKNENRDGHQLATQRHSRTSAIAGIVAWYSRSRADSVSVSRQPGRLPQI